MDNTSLLGLELREQQCYLLCEVVERQPMPLGVFSSYDDLITRHPNVKYGIIGDRLPYKCFVDEYLTGSLEPLFLDCKVDGRTYYYTIQYISCYV